MGQCLCGAKQPIDLSGPTSLKHFEVQRVIGEGGYGKVKAVTKRGETRIRWYAMKVLNKESIVDRNRFREVFRERDLLTQLRHDRICNLYYSFQDEKHLYLVMDIALGGDLRYQLNHNPGGGPFTLDRVRVYIAQVVLALEYVHSKGVIHRDLKPENLLMNGEGWLMLTDFGVARDLDGEGYCYSGSGTSGYMAPELYTRNHKHGKSADWFALGITAHELLTLKRPFRGEQIRRASRALNSSSSNKRPSGADGSNGNGSSNSFSGNDESTWLRMSQRSLSGAVDIPLECIDFLTSLFQLHPQRRLGYKNGAEEVKNHPFFANLDWEAIENGTHDVPFVPNIKRMNAEPDADIHAVFMGDEEERSLRDLSPEEQEKFTGYEYDYRFHESDGDVAQLPDRKFASFTNNSKQTNDDGGPSLPLITNFDQNQGSSRSLTGQVPTMFTPRLPDHDATENRIQSDETVSADTKDEPDGKKTEEEQSPSLASPPIADNKDDEESTTNRDENADINKLVGNEGQDRKYASANSISSAGIDIDLEDDDGSENRHSAPAPPRQNTATTEQYTHGLTQT